MKIDTWEGRRWVIPDVHACIHTLRSLWTTIQVSKKDMVFFLGDYIDRGTDSAAVIEQILLWQSQGYQIYPLLGNHEQMLLQLMGSPIFERHVQDYRCENLLDINAKIKKTYLDFMSNLITFIEMPDAILVHAGLDFSLPQPLEAPLETMLWIRPKDFGLNTTNKILIHGHTPTPLEKIRNDIAQNKNIIALDNGCVYGFRSRGFAQQHQIGNLLAFEINSKALVVVSNQEPPLD